MRECHGRHLLGKRAIYQNYRTTLVILVAIDSIYISDLFRSRQINVLAFERCKAIVTRSICYSISSAVSFKFYHYFPFTNCILMYF